MRTNATLLLAADASQSPLLEMTAAGANPLRHSPYGIQQGMRAAQCHLGLNGELFERAQGWYHLGHGHRVYNPALRRFHSPDALSPFSTGGLNAYAYCQGDPVNFRDPTGTSVEPAQALGFALHSLLQVVGLTMLVLPPLLQRARPGSFLQRFADMKPEAASPIGGLNAAATAAGVMGSAVSVGVNAVTASHPENDSADALLYSALGIAIGVTTIKTLAYFTPTTNFSAPWQKKFAIFVHGRKTVRAAAQRRQRTPRSTPEREPSAVEMWEVPSPVPSQRHLPKPGIQRRYDKIKARATQMRRERTRITHL